MFNSLKLKYTVRNSKKTKEHMKCSYMYMYTHMIFIAVLSLTIQIFHRYLGPNLYIFAVKVSPTFYRDFMTYHSEKTLTKVISC